MDDRRRDAEHAAARGVDKNSLPAGTEIVVDGYRAKNGRTGPTAVTSRCRTGAIVPRLVGDRRRSGEPASDAKK